MLGLENGEGTVEALSCRCWIESIFNERRSLIKEICSKKMEMEFIAAIFDFKILRLQGSITRVITLIISCARYPSSNALLRKSRS